MSLVREISVKENSILIDQKYCINIRKHMPMDPQLAPIFALPQS
ncbi:hypothetical protein A3Q56_07763 [Intoshia linei]|uniref:Uncharacterized protein n=1 Tax=Intoshia linei TaxID=1819745 RepID=A0A177AR96_9BILA|nr:hypothetical protein A3Q56_07763 [Intoshia linei]